MPGILRYIEKLRARPEHERHVWAASLAAVFTLVIGAVWLANFKLTVDAIALAKPATVSPFGQVAGLAATNLGAVKDGLVTVVGGLYNLLVK